MLVFISNRVLTVGICLNAGVAVIPGHGVFPFENVYIPSQNVRIRDRRHLLNLPWNDKTMILMLDAQEFMVKPEVINNGPPSYVIFLSVETDRKEIEAQVYNLQRLVRRRLLMQQKQQALEVVGMGLHPRLGANSPMITVDVLWMVAKHWLLV